MRRTLPPAGVVGIVAALGLTAGSAMWFRHHVTPILMPAATAAGAEVLAPAPAPAVAATSPSAAVAAKAAPAKPNATPDVSADPGAFTAGMRVARDPESGTLGLVPSGEYRELSVDELLAIGEKEGEGAVLIHNADGSETLEHNGKFAEYVIVRTGKDGKPSFECVSGAGMLPHALDPRRPAAPALYEER